MGHILHSYHACADIDSHMATEMRAKVTDFLDKNNFKITLYIDEDNSASKETCFVVCIKAFTDMNNEKDPIIFFLDLLEIEIIKSENIVTQLLLSLKKHQPSHK